MHVTIYLFCYLCIYYMLILFSVIIRNDFSSISSTGLQAHELASQEGISLVVTVKKVSDFGRDQGKGMLHCAVYHIQIVSQCHVCECIG